VAQVHGYCIAGGTQPPLFCDVVSIGAETVVGFPKVPVGGGFISPMWSYRVGSQNARLMSYQVGIEISGQKAHEMGYAALCFPESELAAETFKVAENMAKLPSELLQIKKFANNRVLELQGFRMAVLQAVEWDAIAHAGQTVTDVREWIQELGLKGAISKFAKEGM
jgi:enoyl-CoA hydratase